MSTSMCVYLSFCQGYALLVNLMEQNFRQEWQSNKN